MQKPTHPDVIVQLTGMPADPFAIIDTVAGALTREISDVAAADFLAEAAEVGGYHALIDLVHRTVDAI